MPTYTGQATATSEVTARFFFREPETVTASATATATSTVSQEDANNLAKELAQQIADSKAQNDANIIIQSVNTSTLGEKVFGLGSSIIYDYITKTGDNEYVLTRNFNIPDFLTLRINPKQILSIADGVTLITGRGSIEGKKDSKFISLSGSTVYFGIPNTTKSSTTDTTTTTTVYSSYQVNQGATNYICPNNIVQIGQPTGENEYNGFFIIYGTLNIESSGLLYTAGGNAGGSGGWNGYYDPNTNTITQTGTINILNGGAITISPTDYFWNYSGSINNNGTISNSGAWYNYDGFSNTGIFNAGGQIYNQNLVTSSVTNSGSIYNSGTINSTGTINNDTLIVNLSGTITNSNTITNDGTITNNGTVYDNGTTTNNGTITNNGYWYLGLQNTSLKQYGSYNTSTNTFTLTSNNKLFPSFYNGLYIFDSEVLQINSDVELLYGNNNNEQLFYFINNGTITNDGTITNQLSTTIVYPIIFTNSGTINNQNGNIYTSGNVTLFSGSSITSNFSSSGTVTLNLGGTVTQSTTSFPGNFQYSALDSQQTTSFDFNSGSKWIYSSTYPGQPTSN